MAEQVKLTEHQTAHYETFGFLVLRRVLSGDELKAIDAEFQRGLDAAHRFNPDAGESRQLQWSNVGASYPVMAGLIEDSRICGVAEQLLGDGAIPMFSNSNRWVADTAWHPDTPCTNLRGVKLACYLQPVDGDNGALRVIPGSHKSPLNSEVAGFLSGGGVASRDVPAHVCESEPGDVIAFDNRLYHAAAGSSTDKRQFTMNFLESPRSAAAEHELIELGDVLRRQYKKTNVPPRYFAEEWVANPDENPRRQRMVEWLRAVGIP